MVSATGVETGGQRSAAVAWVDVRMGQPYTNAAALVPKWLLASPRCAACIADTTRWLSRSFLCLEVKRACW